MRTNFVDNAPIKRYIYHKSANFIIQTTRRSKIMYPKSKWGKAATAITGMMALTTLLLIAIAGKIQNSLTAEGGPQGDFRYFLYGPDDNAENWPK